MLVRHGEGKGDRRPLGSRGGLPSSAAARCSALKRTLGEDRFPAGCARVESSSACSRVGRDPGRQNAVARRCRGLRGLRKAQRCGRWLDVAGVRRQIQTFQYHCRAITSVCTRRGNLGGHDATSERVHGAVGQPTRRQALGVVTHAGFVVASVLGLLAIQSSTDRATLDPWNTSITCWRRGSKRWSLECFNDVAHLESSRLSARDHTST